MGNDSGHPQFLSDSGLPIDPVYSADGESPSDDDRMAPGEFPFTRGIYPTMYRGRHWTMRQYAGFGTAEETNERYHFLLQNGLTGLSVAFDLPTQMGFDSDHPMAIGEVGRVGVAIDSLEDVRILFRGISLKEVSTSMTINATAAILLSFYVALADEEGVKRGELRGTVQNDILKEYVARGTYIYPPDPSLRLATDLMAFCSREIPKWNTISISGYHIREAGSTAPQEVAFTLANGLEYVGRAVDRGLDLEEVGPRLSFFFAAHNDLLEEVAKFRAARRLWARLMRERFGASDASCRLRFHTQTGGSTLTAQQPLNNVVRVTIQALASVLGGTQSLHTNSFDEALTLPSEESARLALRTQQILAHESGVTRTVDPLAGSYYLENLTDRIEAEARKYLEEIDRLGGAVQALEMMKEEIHRSAYAHQLAVESGERQVVGMNVFQEDEGPLRAEQPDYRSLEQTQCTKLQELKDSRDADVVRTALHAIRAAAQGSDNLLPPIIDAVKALATLGEIADALREEWGSYDTT